MCGRDWSSDVCSSDLFIAHQRQQCFTAGKRGVILNNVGGVDGQFEVPSLSPTFVPAPPVGVAVSLPSAFALF